MTDPSPDILFSLYHSGAYLCLGIVAAYLALRYASNHVGWLEVPGRAHYVAAALGGLALLVAPAIHGTATYGDAGEQTYVRPGTKPAGLLASTYGRNAVDTDGCTNDCRRFARPCRKTYGSAPSTIGACW